MEIVLALAGLTGLALLLAPSGPLPSEGDYKKALDKLKTAPDDPDANTVVGKYLAFVLGDYASAVPHLAKSSDKTLKTLAEHEMSPQYTDNAIKKVAMGDEWVVAAKAFPVLSRIFMDRASSWYVQAWPEMKTQPFLGDRLRERGQKLAASRPQGSGKKALPGGWKTDGGAVLDGTVARTGSYSVKVPADPKQELNLKSDWIPITGLSIDYSGWVRSEGTDSPTDAIFINYFDKDGRFLGALGVNSPVDMPFWTFLSGKADPPPNAAFVMTGLNIRSKKGTFWVDDMSLKIDGKEVLKNRSFEER